MSLTKIHKLLILAITILQTAAVLASFTINMATASATSYSCSITSANINFGTVNPLDVTPKTVNAVIRITCNNPTNSTANVSYSGGISAGNSGNANSRYMKNGTDTLVYNIYYDSGYTQVYPTSGLGDSYTLAANSSAYRDYVAYGKLPAQNRAIPKTYTDTLIISITY